MCVTTLKVRVLDNSKKNSILIEYNGKTAPVGRSIIERMSIDADGKRADITVPDWLVRDVFDK